MTPIADTANHKNAVNIWADEAIWGHRFHNDQTPWLVLLEFLAVFRSRHLEESALNEQRPNGEHERVKRLRDQAASRTIYSYWFRS